MKSDFIVVEGVIGAGKTTLARKLATSLGAKLLLEQPDENPFLPRFYRDPAGAAFSTQLTFLLQRAGQFEELLQRDLFTQSWVADFMFEKDRLFAELTLSDADLALYVQVFERLAAEVPPPDRLIYLTAPVDILMARIALRGRAYEARIDAHYLDRIAGSYARWFRSQTVARAIEIDTGNFDFVGRDDDYGELLAALESSEGFIRLPRNALL